jgi:hypothetical protein
VFFTVALTWIAAFGLLLFKALALAVVALIFGAEISKLLYESP